MAHRLKDILRNIKLDNISRIIKTGYNHDSIKHCKIFAVESRINY